MLSIQEIQVLLRACQADTEDRALSKAAQGLVDRLGFGRVVGRVWRLTAADRQRISAYLREVEGIDPATPPDAWQERSRIEAAGIGRNEKLAGRRPRAGRIALRAPGGLRFGEGSLSLPARAFIDLPVDAATGLRHDAIVLIENFEAFIYFEEANAGLPCSTPLLAFRGDGINTPDAMLEFLRLTKLPVIAWPDFDPAGLLLSSGLPGLSGILAPAEPDECLARRGRSDLYLNQLGQLAALRLSGPSRLLEQAIRAQRKGIDQERMIAERIPLHYWAVGSCPTVSG